jgi:hypothetical protein
MNKIIKYHFIWGLSALFLLLVNVPLVEAQITDTTNTESGRRGAPRVYKYSTRTTALGDATVADPHDLSVININPAGLSFVRDIKVAQFNLHQNWNNNLMYENFSFPVFKMYNHTIAAQFTMHQRGFQSTNILGSSPFPQPQITMYQLDVVYSFSIGNVLSLGVLNNFTLAKNQIAQYWTYYPTLGLMYAPTQSISYGIAFRGLGRSIVYQFPGNDITTLGSQDLRESLEIGATLYFPVDTDRTFLSISMANEKRFGEKGMWYKAGMELTSIPHIALRSGLIVHPEDNLYAPRFGIGIDSNVIEVDYSISYEKRLYERFHQLGITLHLDKI